MLSPWFHLVAPAGLRAAVAFELMEENQSGVGIVK